MHNEIKPNGKKGKKIRRQQRAAERQEAYSRLSIDEKLAKAGAKQTAKLERDKWAESDAR